MAPMGPQKKPKPPSVPHATSAWATNGLSQRICSAGGFRVPLRSRAPVPYANDHRKAVPTDSTSMATYDRPVEAPVRFSHDEKNSPIEPNANPVASTTM